ncbi:hypothetical protein Kpol_1013p65 [Vanderwaltozyma polyspora DSM 70294]|uniref:Vesicular-fusion protein SEC17 n=1 Tax=Vanderwaltozyma polyspora (strain ATCC 22028 / DSM 70294 / BCRC 21397 / CBS 2163 / NBRC 10782 / NRRL Y-8283 / UCD 57-17) TaxID=436907 RepID=A7THA9_VANPO|nr:uncharacterized protein Kpol_1013p65 [Vanderwaltozyma polyspora DSM 70294]EDO18390.1 hypothetical protein Kpol_1013p65 [Vanderwaltozyma polyspora DSM 70294]
MSDPNELIERADKKGVPSSGLMKIFGSSDSSKFEEAADLCVQAANLYRLRKELSKAGDALVKAADYQIKAGNDDEAGNTFIEASKCYKSSNNAGESNKNAQNAANSLSNAIEIFTKRGQFRRGANFKFELGELMENELQDYKSAMECYEIAGEWYSQDQALALTNKCLLKLASLKALDGSYLDAAQVYSKLIQNSVGNRLSQWSLKEYYLKMGLCQLAAGDSVAATRTLQEGNHQDSNFAGSRESALLETLIQCVNDGDSEKLSQTVFDYDKFSKLDKWYTTILLKIKDSITEAEDDLL